MANETVNLLQYGLGNVGRALARMILAHGEATGLRHVGLADSSGVVWVPEGVPEATLDELLDVKEDGGRLTDHPLAHHQGEALPIEESATLEGPTVLVDCTASAQMTPRIIQARSTGLHVVLANKLPLVESLTQYRALTGAACGALRYEVTVGAGLPIIRTVQGLLASGDQVQQIEGCFSGTLGYLFSRLEEGALFSVAVREAWKLGYTEPDPREDLAGWDVARKALILARLVGYELELSQVAVEPLFPDEMADMPVQDFVERVTLLDGRYTQAHTKAQAEGKVLRYMAHVADGTCRVGLVEVPQQGRLGSLRGPENMVVLHTTRYSDVPLTIAGPGAGPEVTAAGVLTDILDTVRKG